MIKMKKQLNILSTFLLVLIADISFSQITDAEYRLTKGIVINQVGFINNDQKEAVLLLDTTVTSVGKFQIRNAANQIVFTGTPRFWGKSWRRNSWILDFSSLVETGDYKISAQGYTSFQFRISNNVWKEKGNIPKVFDEFINHVRINFAKYPGDKARNVYSYNNTSKIWTKQNYTWPIGYGWQDAHSQDQHLSHAQIVLNLLWAWEAEPKLFAYDIQEGLPMILNEARHGLRYLLAMQRSNGNFITGTYASFDPDPRALKDSPDTDLNMLASAALASGSRIFRDYNNAFADSCMNYAIKGVKWSDDNPGIRGDGTAIYWQVRYDAHITCFHEMWLAFKKINSPQASSFQDKLNAALIKGKIHSPVASQCWYLSGTGNDWNGNLGFKNLFNRGSLIATQARYFKDAPSDVKTKIEIDFTKIKDFIGGEIDNPYGWSDQFMVETFGSQGYIMAAANNLFHIAKVLNNPNVRRIALNHMSSIIGKNPMGNGHIMGIGTKWKNNEWSTDEGMLTGTFLPGLILTNGIPTDNCSLSGNLGSMGWRCDEFINAYTVSFLYGMALVSEGVIENETYLGTPIPIPGTIEAENYDKGGEGLSYHDEDAVNLGGQYRTDGVDIGAIPSGGNFVGYTATGEWMEYTINVAEAGNYDFVMSTSSLGGAGLMSIDLDGTLLKSSIPLPKTVDWNTFVISTIRVSLPVGKHLLRLNVQNFGFNIDKILVKASLATGVDMELENEQFAIYPNPSQNGVFNLSQSANWKVNSILGKELMSGNGAQVNLSGYSKGVYLIKINDKVERVVVE